MKTSNFQKEKILCMVAYLSKHTRYCGITKLFKLFFAADMEHFKETGKTITGLDYFTYPRGPVPKELYEEIDDETSFFGENIAFKIPAFGGKLKQIYTKFSFKDSHFSKREINILKKTSFIFKEAYAKDMVKCSHDIDQPWTITMNTKGEYQPIDLILSLDGSANTISADEYKDRQKEQSTVLDMLYG